MAELIHTWPIFAAGIDIGDTIWVIFVVIWGIIQMFSKKGPEVDGPADPEAAERARRIQEEIRRRIMERRRETPPTHQGPTPPFSHTGSDSPQMAPQQAPDQPHVFQAPQSPPMPQRPDPEPEYRQPQPKTSSPSYAQQIEAQRKRIEETRRKSEALIKKAFGGKSSEDPSKNKWGHNQYQKKRSPQTQSLIKTLKSPQALKEAILVREIIGPPKSLE